MKVKESKLDSKDDFYFDANSIFLLHPDHMFVLSLDSEIQIHIDEMKKLQKVSEQLA